MLKRKALIAEFGRKWPTIERDLNDASRNGLEKAKAPGAHGVWEVEQALDWARTKGKLKADAAVQPGWPTSVARRDRRK